MDYIGIGKIVNTHGLRGEVRIESWSDFDDVRYSGEHPVFIEYNGEMIEVRPVSFRMHKGFALVSFEGLQDINLVEKYKNCIVYIADDDRHELDDGEFYMDELTGMQVRSEDGQLIGTVIGFEPTNGAQNNLRVERDGDSDVLIPFVPAFIADVDPDTEVITVRVIEGLL